MSPVARKPEEEAREIIDARLADAGWVIQTRDEMNLTAGRGVAVCEFKLTNGFADYMLFVDKRPVGVVEAKPVGQSLTGVEPQTKNYSEGLPPELDAPVLPLPFLYISTGEETTLTNLRDPKPRSRHLFQFHRPKTLAEWLQSPDLSSWVDGWHPESMVAEPADGPSSFRSRLQTLPPVDVPGLWPNQITAISNLEASLKANKPRALIQMATGSGKTIMAVTSIYRLIKYAGARRILFLVDRKNLGQQAEKEFQSYVTPHENRKFTELYNVQRLTSNHIADSTKVVVTTVQRLYSMLKGDDDLDPDAEEGSQFDASGEPIREPPPVVYNPQIPIEYFDVIFIDECHRSIYSLWRQVLEYFDAFLVGLTATPAKHTFGFFNKNLVMEYGYEQAVADGVNVDHELYTIRTRITEQGSTIEAGPHTVLGVRDKHTRAVRWEKPDEDVSYSASDLDRAVVASDQIRTIIRAFRDHLFTKIFPGRRHVPKTLIFAKDDSHADDIVRIVREEFDEGNDFCQKITYKVTGKKPRELIQEFRISFNPRIAVTVDMVATGTDIKPVEIVMFMRAIQSRTYYEQMKGRGVRVIGRDELQAVSPDAPDKTHFVLVDCVGILETDLADTQPLERKKSVAFNTLLEHVAAGGTDPDLLSTLAGRLARLDRQCGATEREQIAAVGEGVAVADISGAIIRALDPDHQLEAARQRFEIPDGEQPTPEQLEEVRRDLSAQAVEPLAANPDLRNLLFTLKKQFDQILDDVSIDEVTHAGFDPEAKQKAQDLVQSFEQFLEENRDEIDALEFFYSQPYDRRLTYSDIKELAQAIELPPRSWTPERLWRAYQTLDRSKVRGSAQRVLTDLVSLVRFALHQDKELAPYADRVQVRFDQWLAQQANKGRQFTPQQQQWLEMIRDHIATSLGIEPGDFDLTPFAEQGGLGKAAQVFGDQWPGILGELNAELAV